MSCCLLAQLTSIKGGSLTPVFGLLIDTALKGSLLILAAAIAGVFPSRTIRRRATCCVERGCHRTPRAADSHAARSAVAASASSSTAMARYSRGGQCAAGESVCSDPAAGRSI